MKTRDLSELAVRNLREAILRNSLTTLGIAVGVASLVAMLSLGVGLQALASQRLTRSGLFDSVFVSGRDMRGGPNRRPEKPDAPKKTRSLDEPARQQIAKLPNVTEVYPQVRFLAELRVGSVSSNSSVLGLPDSTKSSAALEGMTGKYFSAPLANEVILQRELAEELVEGKPALVNSLVGKDLTIRYAQRSPSAAAGVEDFPLFGDALKDLAPGGLSIVTKEQSLRIVGIVENDPSPGLGGFGGARVFVPLGLAEQLNPAQANDLQTLLGDSPENPAYTALTVRVTSPKYVAKTESAIKDMGFSTFSLLDATRGLRIVFTVFDLFLGLFGSLALTVASLGIVNTLVMSILERRREIGVLKALGATDRDVRQLFFAEAASMGLFGGLFGVLLGWLIGQALNFGAAIYLKRQDLPSVQISSVPLWLALSAIVFAVVVSFVAGIYPAARAAKLNPVEALRYE